MFIVILVLSFVAFLGVRRVRRARRFRGALERAANMTRDREGPLFPRWPKGMG